MDLSPKPLRAGSEERQTVCAEIGDSENKIGGVVLVGGDIHVSRHLEYPMKERMGYDLHQFSISPLHDRVIPSLNCHTRIFMGRATQEHVPDCHR